jgi:hypothetical protein
MRGDKYNCVICGNPCEQKGWHKELSKTCSRSCQGRLPSNCFVRIKREAPEIRFWRNVKKTDSCWFWIGAKMNYGYGILEKGSQVKISAHRFSYELHKGEIPKGLEVCHSCDNPPCVNPDHLWIGTHTENMRDAKKKGRLSSNGGRYPKLTMSQIREVQKIGYSQPMWKTGEQYGVERSSIRRILSKELKVLSK